MNVILASTSPARLGLLRSAGIEPILLSPGVDEAAAVAQAGRLTVKEEATLLAHLKGEAAVAQLLSGAHQLSADEAGDTAVLFASDSILDLHGEAVGKPHTPQRTRDIWERMAGQQTTLHTGHYAALLQRTAGTWSVVDAGEHTESTTISTGTPSAEELEDYIASGEPLHVAGALTIDGRGAAFIEGIVGDHSNVIGLSMPTVRMLSAKLGVRWTALWNIDTPEGH